jgi:hypothetical protein
MAVDTARDGPWLALEGFGRSLGGGGWLRVNCIVLATCLGLVGRAPALGQERPTGLEVAGLPALGFDADEGFGYGVLAEVYHYGDGAREPYLWTVQPKIYLTTRGRRDITLFFDAPWLIPGGWRVSGYVGTERKLFSPYYGLGNGSTYQAVLEDPDGPNPRYYSFGRLRHIGRVDLQRPIAGLPLRLLVGAGMVRSEIDPVPEDVGTTVYAGEVATEVETRWTNFVRGGLVWDTRDRETAPRRGVWTEVLLQWVDEELGADYGYRRWTIIDRRYFSLTDRLVVAHRYLLQGVSGNAPVDELQRIETSFKAGEGLGGSSSVRGILKNRYTGKGMLAWNAELRWRVLDFEMAGRALHVGVSAFLDQGRVWEGGVQLRELLSGLHRGYGGGLHGGMGENFVGSLYAGTSAETGVKLYLGLGYLY